MPDDALRLKKAVNIAFMPTRRIIWRDLAAALTDHGLVPAIWLGDWKHEEFARTSYPECDVLDFQQIHVRVTSQPGEVDTVAPASILLSRRFATLREQVFKLMDRQDPVRTFGRLEREALFYGNFTRLFALVNSRDIKALVIAEAPHSPAQLILFGICELLGIPTYFLVGNTVVPLVHVTTEIMGEPIARHGDANLDFHRAELRAYIDSFDQGIPQPLYMKRQAEFDNGLNIVSFLARKILRTAKIRFTARTRNALPPEDYEIHNRYPGQERMPSILEPLRIEKLRRNLARAHARAQEGESFTKWGKYVYFPLHFEPERTSNPDGGEFYNSLDALISLRAFLPDNIAIVVKEHPSQFSRSLEGYKGRSPLVYDVITSLANVHLVGLGAPSAELVRNAEAVASLTGTACLEAAITGVKSILFGNSWFARFPNISRFSELASFDEFARTPLKSKADMSAWMDEYVSVAAIPGWVNPSNERYFRRKFPADGPSLDTDADTVRLVAETIAADFAERASR